MNQAFLFSFFLSTGLALLAVPYAKRRPVGTPFTWGEAMVASVWTFALMFLAFGVVPHQWLTHADKDLGWNRTKIIYGPWDILKPKALGGNFPMTLQYEAIRDVIVVVIHLWYFGLVIYLWTMWQNRGKKAEAAAKEIATSSYGRPLVKKA
ncbi:MAG: hypothetical protein U0Q03_08600 [Acidimicrobiales bacterium]